MSSSTRGPRRRRRAKSHHNFEIAPPAAVAPAPACPKNLAPSSALSTPASGECTGPPLTSQRQEMTSNRRPDHSFAFFSKQLFVNKSAILKGTATSYESEIPKNDYFFSQRKLSSFNDIVDISGRDFVFWFFSGRSVALPPLPPLGVTLCDKLAIIRECPVGVCRKCS